MGILFDEIINDLVLSFGIHDKNNLLIKKTIGKGFSGAEVYLIELIGDSIHKGSYFLKIDTEDDEFKNVKQGYCFTKAAVAIEAKKIKDYFVMILEIAGKSLIQYKAFYEIEDIKERKKAIQKIVPDILESGTKYRTYICEETDASSLFSAQLLDKLKSGNVLEQYISSITRKEKACEVRGFVFGDGKCLPNAYAYAVNDLLWEGKKLRNTNCCIHGDFHGDNVFYFDEKEEYAMIDFALYRQDGYVFFDTAYFELSLLLHNFESMELMEWISLTGKMAYKKWNEVDCKDKAIFQLIEETENAWIARKTDGFHNYTDSLLEAKLIARILSGLNYAGKKKVSVEIRKKSFLYACRYLERLLDIKSVNNWKSKMLEWKEIEKRCENDELRKLCSDLENFNDSQKYVLVLGDKYDYAAEVYQALTRIHWNGVVSFKRSEGIEAHFRKYNVLNAITIVNDMDLISPENLWCLYANGVDYNPDTICDSFPKWRNAYVNFFNKWVQKLNISIAPDGLQIIIDLNSFSSNYIKHLNRMCESLDLIQNTNVNIAILNKGDEELFAETDVYDRIFCEDYRTTLESIAEFCLKYLKGMNEEDVTIPAITNIRKTIPSDDYKFIKNYVLLLHNKVIQYEGNVDEAEKRGFYYGKSILWQAIEERLYIEREEYQEFEDKIKKEIEETNQFLIRVPHSPGAGASIMCRVLGWKLRNMYPVVIAENMNKNIVQCIQRLYSLSGKHILLFLDGDFSENDVAQLLQQSRHMGIKIGIVFPYRCYEKVECYLSVLSINDALSFRREYTNEMRYLKKYLEEEINTRSQNMKKLAEERSLINYCLPFFFGINAFEDDYQSIPDYLQGIMEHISNNEQLSRIVNYIALITSYTEKDGLNITYVRKILNLDRKTPPKEILKMLNGDINNFVYYTNGALKICHSVVATEILKKQYKFCSSEFESFLEQFVKDVCACEGKGRLSEKLNNLLMNLFIKRDIEGDISDNLRKKNFSPILILLNNSYLQETFFAFLSSQIPDNAHFKQHYGRLIIYNNPDKLDAAKEQFDEAIKLEPLSPLHYHARGVMYTKYVMNLCRNKCKDSTAQGLFNEISKLTEAAVNDYETSIRLIRSCVDVMIDLSYPYASIVQTITYVVHQLYLKDNTEKEEKEYLALNTDMVKWCRELIHKAKQYDMETETRYDVIRNNEFYNKTRNYLIKYRYTKKEIEKKMAKSPDDLELMKEYLYAVDTKKEKWEWKTQEELKRIIECCKKIMSSSKNVSEGVLWRWFNASINFKKVNVVEMNAFLETLDCAEDSLTVQFMLYVIKLGRYLQSYDERTLSEILHHIERCKKLNQNSNRVSTRYYYNGQNEVGFCYEKDDAKNLTGRVTRWESPQNGHLSLEIQPKLSAFFVPSVIGMWEEGAVGSRVSLKLGVSFDGLRAWDLQIKQ